LQKKESGAIIKKKQEVCMRIGMGYDVHKLVLDRKLILGGVEIPYEKGLLGHSDADVLVHAIMDALLGAAAEGDIGRHFPDTDPAYKGISSLELLRRVGDLLEEKLYVIENIDATIVAQKPKLASYLPQMVTQIEETLGLEPGQVNVKATTEEGLGFTGSGEGISAQAVALLQEMIRSDPMERTFFETEGGRCEGCRGCHRENQRESQEDK
jgi:2-C-methyl-D-erythritol 2,4-cyclodiphosphate synthase